MIWWVVMKNLSAVRTSAVCESDRFIEFTVGLQLQVQNFAISRIYLAFSVYSSSSASVFSIDSFGMADVSDPKIQEGSFHSYTQQMPAM
jgi:hypothetical protein